MHKFLPPLPLVDKHKFLTDALHASFTANKQNNNKTTPKAIGSVI